MGATGSHRGHKVDGMKYEKMPTWQKGKNPRSQPTLRGKSGAPKATVKNAAKLKTKSNSKERTSSESARQYEYVPTSVMDSASVPTNTDGSTTIRMTSLSGFKRHGRVHISRNLEDSQFQATARKLIGMSGSSSSKTSSKESKIKNLLWKMLENLNRPRFSWFNFATILVLFLLVRYLAAHLQINWR